MNAHPSATLRDGRHHYFVRVYFEDTDAGGVVYHANYLRFAERARTEAMRDIGAPHAEMTSQAGLIFMVRRVKLDYLAPARVDDLLLVTTELQAVGAASVKIRQTFKLADASDALLAILEVQLACVRLGDARAARIPPRWREAMARRLMAAASLPD
jgi:acyl-CoA thioester hydrolase